MRLEAGKDLNSRHDAIGRPFRGAAHVHVFDEPDLCTHRLSVLHQVHELIIALSNSDAEQLKKKVALLAFLWIARAFREEDASERGQRDVIKPVAASKYVPAASAGDTAVSPTPLIEIGLPPGDTAKSFGRLITPPGCTDQLVVSTSAMNASL